MCDNFEWMDVCVLEGGGEWYAVESGSYCFGAVTVTQYPLAIKPYDCLDHIGKLELLLLLLLLLTYQKVRLFPKHSWI